MLGSVETLWSVVCAWGPLEFGLGCPALTTALSISMRKDVRKKNLFIFLCRIYCRCPAYRCPKKPTCNFRFVKNLVKTVSTVCCIKPLIVKHTICARVWGTMVAAIYACLYYRIFQSMNEIKVIQTIVTLVSSVMSFRSCHAACRSTGITSCGGSKSIASPIPTAQTHEPNWPIF